MQRERDGRLRAAAVRQEEALKERKKRLRREALTQEERAAYSAAIRERAERLSVYREAAVLCFYVDIRSEVETKLWITEALAKGRAVAVPKVEGGRLCFYRIGACSELRSGYRGILEPEGREAARLHFSAELPEERALFLLPGAAFDKNGGRIGYGGGFYDRYLADHKGARRVGLAYACQMVEEVPCEAHDIRTELVITERDKFESKLSNIDW